MVNRKMGKPTKRKTTMSISRKVGIMKPKKTKIVKLQIGHHMDNVLLLAVVELKLGKLTAQ